VGGEKIFESLTSLKIAIPGKEVGFGNMLEELSKGLIARPHGEKTVQPFLLEVFKEEAKKEGKSKEKRRARGMSCGKGIGSGGSLERFSEETKKTKCKGKRRKVLKRSSAKKR